eukprot:4640134-Alexandrium_andersonii.AAC.1
MFEPVAPADGGRKPAAFEDPLTATVYADRQVFTLHFSIADLVVGQPVEPVREHGPRMIAPRLEDPKGSLQISIGIQHHG